MTHARTSVRDAMATTLTGLAATGSRVYKVRKYALAATDLPALRIYTESDEPEEFTVHNSVQPTLRTVQVVVEAVAKATTEVEDTVDTICEQVEAAIVAAPTLSGVARGIVYRGFDSDMDSEGDQPVMVGRMRFDVSVQG